MKKQILQGLIITLFSFGIAQIAQATLMYYYNDPVTDRTNFQAAAGVPLSTESFEDSFADSSNLSFPIGGPQEFTVSISTGQFTQWDTMLGRLITDGNYSLAFAEYPSATITFTFDNPINFFGLVQCKI